MPSSVVFVMSIELALVLVTTLLLAQPKLIFHSFSGRTQAAARWGGMFFLGLTFCWSVVVGFILSMNDMAIRL